MKPDEQAQIDEVLIVPMPGSDHPGRLRERAQALEITETITGSKYMERVRTEACNGCGEAKREPKKAPRVPRDTEPMHLVEVAGLVAGGFSVFLLTAYAFGWSARAVAEWIGGVL